MRPDQAIEPLHRFMTHVSVTDGCWEWTGGIATNGYGKFSYGSRRDNSQRTVGSHRFSYERLVGPIPCGLAIDHLCRNRACVNPDHLEAVSTRTNILRGVSVVAKNARKTHCKRGHEFTEENTYLMNSGGRMCRTCQRAALQRYEARRPKRIRKRS